MKKLMIAAMSLALTALIGSAYAGEGCCPGMKAEKKAEGECTYKAAKGDCGAACFEGIELSAEQKEQLAALKAECGKGECDESSKQAMKDGLKKILTEEQYAAMQANCAKKECGSKAVDG